MNEVERVWKKADSIEGWKSKLMEVINRMVMVDNERRKRAIRIKPRVWADTKKLAVLEEKKVGDLAGDLVEEALGLEKYQKILKG